MTTTELIKILQDNETGAISLKPREISLTINGRYMPNPQITLSSTGDGICGAEIDLDIDGEWLEQEPIKGHWIKEESIYGWDGHSYQCSECGRSIHLDTEMEDLEDYPYCHCGCKMEVR